VYGIALVSMSAACMAAGLLLILLGLVVARVYG